jgi:hypothetical protein
LHSALTHKPNVRVATNAKKHQQNITKKAPINTNKTHQGGANKHQYNTTKCVDEQQGGDEEYQGSTTRGHHKHQQNVVSGHQQAPIKPNKGALTNINKSQKGNVDEH